MFVQENVPLAPLTTFRVGGMARYFITIKSTHDLNKSVTFSKEMGLPIFVLGGGSNVLVDDAGWPGVVLHIALRGISFEERGEIVYATVSAGESWDSFVATTVKYGLWGIENLSGIPGTTGAAPIQNIGAYGVDVSQHIEWIEAYDCKHEEVVRFSNNECRFAYRDSFFKTSEGKRYIVTRLCFRLSRVARPNTSYPGISAYVDATPLDNLTPDDMRTVILAIRREKFPDLSRIGTAGSFFKNPVISEAEYNDLLSKFPDIHIYKIDNSQIKIPLAWLLDRLGWKGVCEGDVCAFEKQPLIIINRGGASAKEVKKFAGMIVEDVHKKTGIKIVPEVIYVADEQQ